MNKGDKIYCVKANLPKYITQRKSYTVLDVDVAGQRIVLMNDNKYTDWYPMNDFQILEDAFKVGETVFSHIDNDHFIKGGKYRVLETIDNKGRYLLEDKNKKAVRFGVTNFSRIAPIVNTSVPTITQSTKKVRGPHKCTCDFYKVIVSVGCQCGGL